MFSLKPHRLNELKRSAYVWFCDTTTFPPEHIKACLGLLSGDESHRHAAIRSTDDAGCYAVSHALLRQALSSFTGTGHSMPVPREWLFTTEASGKPVIEASQNQRDLRFSLSHCSTACAVIITQGRDCGIDIEDNRREIDHMKIAGKMFTAHEADLLRSSEDPRDTFFRLWTLREARAKATGQGLANSARDFGFVLDEDEISYRRYSETDSEHDWQFVTLEPLTDHILAIAIQYPDADDRTDLDIHTIQVKP